MNKIIIALLLCTIPFFAISAEPDSETISAQQFEKWFSEISNWGRWGQEDELGTLNLITQEIKTRAAGLVKQGITVSLALNLDKQKSNFNTHPFEHSSSVHDFGNHAIVSDRYAVEYHGAAHTHLDALSHMAYNRESYNGFPADKTMPDGPGKLGIHNMKGGIFTRGVLVDMPLLRGVDFLERGDAITVADLEAWEVKTGIRIGSGDVLLVRTGRWQLDRTDGARHLTQGAAGLHASVAKWLKQKDVAILGSDGGNDVIPSGVEGLQAPVHVLALVSLGMPLMDNLDLDVLASEALKYERWEFLFICAPLRAQGGSGSPVNPLAVF